MNYSELNEAQQSMVRHMYECQTAEQWFDDAGELYQWKILGWEDEDDAVPEGSACPNCGEDECDNLEWIEGGAKVECDSCGHTYDPEEKIVVVGVENSGG